MSRPLDRTAGESKPALRYYFSLRSPYSWLAHLELTSRNPHLLAKLQWCPFWEPDESIERAVEAAGGRFLYTPMSKHKHLYILQDVRRLTAARGLSVAWPVDARPRWEVPHLAYLAAVRFGKGPDFVTAVYHARWQEGRDICDERVIEDIAITIDVPPEPLVGAAADADLRAEGVRCLLAVHRDGVFGVPMFLVGRERYWGLDRLADFVERISAEFAPPTDSAPTVSFTSAVRATNGARATAAEFDHAGGCG